MLKDGLVYSESRMGYEQEFMEDLAAFELKSSCGTFRGAAVSDCDVRSFGEAPFCSERMISAIPITVTVMV